jgi:O-antigen/teichoic acid export membrane protein
VCAPEVCVRVLQDEWRRFRSSSLAHNAGWMLLGQGMSIFCQGAYFILLARLLGPFEYGIYAGVFAMVTVVSAYSALGSPLTLLRHVSPEPDKVALYWGNVLIITLTLGSLFAGLLVWTVPHLAHSYSWRLVVCAAVGDCLFVQLAEASARVFQAFEKMRSTAILKLLTNLLRTLLAGFLLWHLHHATAQQWVVATLAVSFAVACSAIALVIRRFGKPAFSPRLLRQRIGEGLVFAVSESTTGIYNNFDKAMLGHYGMNAVNGIYTMAYRVVDVCTVPMGSVHAAAFPRFFRKGSGGVQETTAYALRILKRTGPVAMLLTVAMALAAPVIPHFVGSSFSDSVVALRWLCLLPLFRSFQYSAGDALTGAGHQKLRLGAQTLAAAFNFIINLYLIPHYGWRGAAWSSLATDGLLGISNWTVLLAIRAQVPQLQLAERQP